jgi:hypothetical protein
MRPVTVEEWVIILVKADVDEKLTRTMKIATPRKNLFGVSVQMRLHTGE